VPALSKEIGSKLDARLTVAAVQLALNGPVPVPVPQVVVGAENTQGHTRSMTVPVLVTLQLAVVADL
jgi:hypothetical protein